MIRIRNEQIYRHIKNEIGNDNITPELLIDFCNNNNYTCGLLKYNEDGLYYNDNENNLCILDFFAELIKGKGIFSKFENTDDNTELYKVLDEQLTKMENGEFDIIYINDTHISIRRT